MAGTDDRDEPGRVKLLVIAMWLWTIAGVVTGLAAVALAASGRGHSIQDAMAAVGFFGAAWVAHLAVQTTRSGGS